MKKSARNFAFAAIIALTNASPAAAFEPHYVGQGSYWASTSIFESDADVARQVAAFCRKKGFTDFAMGIRTTDIFAEQNFVCLNDGDAAVPAYPNSGFPPIVPVIPF